MDKIVGNLDHNKCATQKSVIDSISEQIYFPKELVNIIYGYCPPKINWLITQINRVNGKISVYVSEDKNEFVELELPNDKWDIISVVNSGNKILFVRRSGTDIFIECYEYYDNVKNTQLDGYATYPNENRGWYNDIVFKNNKIYLLSDIVYDNVEGTPCIDIYDRELNSWSNLDTCGIYRVVIVARKLS